jgi:hypothetical protein
MDFRKFLEKNKTKVVLAVIAVIVVISLIQGLM